jgi:hypothetical protein
VRAIALHEGENKPRLRCSFAVGTLVHLSHYRREPQLATPRPAGHPYYYCTRCEGEQFMLGPSGEVQCVRCGALMRNLSVTDQR